MDMAASSDGRLYIVHEHADLVVSTIAVAMFGGFVKWMMKEPHDYLKLIIALIAAGFSGLMSHYVTHWLELDEHLQCFISGITGYGGVVFLDDAVKRVRGFMNGGNDTLEKAVNGTKKEK